MSKLIYLFSVLLTLSACVEIKNMDEAKGATPPVSTQALDFSYQISEGNGVNQFGVQLHIPDGVYLLVRKNESAVADYQVAVNKTFIDNNVQAGTHYTYQLGYLRGEDFVDVQDLEVQVPFDLYVRGRFSVENQKQVRVLENLRLLYFVDGAELVTNGFSIHIKAKNIVSNNGKVMTFLPGTTATYGIAGRSGGDLTLDSLAAEGILNIEMRGENGAAGANASDLGEGSPQSGNPGTPGTDGGSSGKLHLQVPNQIKVVVSHQPGIGGTGGIGGLGTKYVHCYGPRHSEFDFTECEHVGPRGPQGANGKNGESGLTCTLNYKNKEDCR